MLKLEAGKRLLAFAMKNPELIIETCCIPGPAVKIELRWAGLTDDCNIILFNQPKRSKSFGSA
jgi:hypothetical protein